MDEEVQHLLREGRRREALEQLLERYETKVFSMAVALIRDRARAEDVTQDIFLKVWQGLPDYDGRASPGTWLYTIARNTCLSFLRSESYRRVLPLDAARDPAAPAQPKMADFELSELMDRLPEVQRTAITLFYFQDKSVGEVALMLGIPEGTVKSHLHRARIALCEIMKDIR
jgi:RNA polymerase sigma-70 factor (ECF subfamily)